MVYTSYTQPTFNGRSVQVNGQQILFKDPFNDGRRLFQLFPKGIRNLQCHRLTVIMSGATLARQEAR